MFFWIKNKLPTTACFKLNEWKKQRFSTKREPTNAFGIRSSKILGPQNSKWNSALNREKERGRKRSENNNNSLFSIGKKRILTSQSHFTRFDRFIFLSFFFFIIIITTDERVKGSATWNYKFLKRESKLQTWTYNNMKSKKSIENFVEGRGYVNGRRRGWCNGTKIHSSFILRRSWTEYHRGWQRKEQTRVTPQPSTWWECWEKVQMYPWVGLRLCPR